MSSHTIDPNPTVRSEVNKLLFLQAALVAGVSSVFGYFGSQEMGFSALLGGMIALLPTSFYGWQIVSNPEQIANLVFRRHIRGQLGKYFLTFLLFSITFLFFNQVNIIALFSSYLFALLVYWVALATFKDRVGVNGKS